MYLKRLEMHGFKSFAKKADLSFTQNITMVVGPNGSGKSNIVDAIRWVLGEGSAKSLRGAKMEDVIFAGSSEKKALGMAQVSLTLDNSTGIFPIDYTEIKITRKLYRSGESEYLINNTRCRLKDIHELIMDTGIGRDSFAIIGQGKVDQILLSQADEKRILIEEVAGVSKYRYRKNEAKRKLADTEQSLCRVYDIIAELRSRQEPLREQSVKAKRYRELKKELDELEIKTAKFMIGSLQEKAAKKTELLESLRKQFLEADTGIQKAEAAGEEQSVMIEKMISAIGESQSELFAAESRISEHKSKLELSSTMLQTYTENLAKTQDTLQRLNEEAQTLEDKKEAEQKQYLLVKKEYEEALEKIKTEEQALFAIQHSESRQHELAVESKNRIFDHVQQMTAKKNQLIDIDKETAVLESRLESAEAKMAESSERFTEIGRQKADIEKEKKKVMETAGTMAKEIDKITRQSDADHHAIAEMQENIKNQEKIKMSLLADKNALQKLEENREGYYAGVKHVIQNKALRGIKGTVADIISTDSRYITAIETALGAGIQNVITADEESAKAAIRYLHQEKKGRATFLPLATIAQRGAKKALPVIESLQRAVDLVEYQDEYQPVVDYLLGNIYVAGTIDQAVQINQNLARPVRIITLQGEVLDPRGAITGGAHRHQQGGLLQRKERMQALTRQIGEQDRVIAELNLKQSDIQSGMDIRKQRLEDIKSEYDEIQVSLQKTETIIAQLLYQEQEINNDLLYLESEHETIKHTWETLQKQRSDLEQELQFSEQEKERLEKDFNEGQQKAEQEKQRFYELEKDLNRKQIEFNDLKNKKQNLKNQYQSMVERLEELIHRQKQLSQEEAEQLQKISGYKKDMTEQQEAIKQQSLAWKLLSEKLEEKKQSRDVLENSKRQNDILIREKRRETDALKDQIHQEEVQTEKYKTEARTYMEALEERFGIEWDSIFPEMSEGFNERSAKSRIRELKREIDYLGEVNLTAITEYEKLMERSTFLQEQSEDLQKAQESLNQIITEMDQIIIRKFKDTYARLNASFKETFREMFNGGHAEIVMTDKDNVLETGIDIIAQPPGKTLKHLSLLSGGEKAMTAICLLFAIIKIKPGPFCILDEIEASLDEANVNRFAKFLKTFSELTQFIVISHRKGTMEAADVLYGVTMEDKGVSNLISVRISETIKLSG